MNKPNGRPPEGMPPDMIAIPPGQEGFFICECGSKSFKFEDTINIVFDRINPRHIGMVPEGRVLYCGTCRKEYPTDENLEVMVRSQSRKIEEP